jgi:hypothetical protein
MVIKSITTETLNSFSTFFIYIDHVSLPSRKVIVDCVRLMVIREKQATVIAAYIMWNHIMKVNETNKVKLHAFSILVSTFCLLFWQQETNGWGPFYVGYIMCII